jgi:IS605 OrfB family transposase
MKVTRCVSLGFANHKQTAACFADAFYLGAMAHNVMMDRLVEKQATKAPRTDVPLKVGGKVERDAQGMGSEGAVNPFAWRYGYQAANATEKCQPLDGTLVNQIERGQVEPEFKRYRDDRFKRKRNASIPYKSRLGSLGLHASCWELRQTDRGCEVRCKVWRSDATKLGEKAQERLAANVTWHEVYPMGPKDEERLHEALKADGKLGQPRLCWQKEARNWKRRWRLEIPLQVEMDEVHGRGTLAAGIDLGERNLAVVSIPELRRKVYFSHRDLVHRRRRYEKKRREIGKGWGSHATARLRDKEACSTKTLIQTVARQIVLWVLRYPAVGIIRMEDLSGIRDGADKRSVGEDRARMLSAFPYGMLQGMIRQRAEEYGLRVELVPAKGTSTTCSRCGQPGKRDNKTGWFYCQACADAGARDKGFMCGDLNAANNIAAGGVVEIAPRSTAVVRAAPTTRRMGSRDAGKKEEPAGYAPNPEW